MFVDLILEVMFFKLFVFCFNVWNESMEKYLYFVFLVILLLFEMVL